MHGGVSLRRPLGGGHQRDREGVRLPRDLGEEGLVEAEVGAVDPRLGPPAFVPPEGKILEQVELAVLVPGYVHGVSSFR